MPDVKELESRVRDGLGGDDQKAFDLQIKGRNIEGVLSRLRRIAGLVRGTETVDGLSADQASALDVTICHRIVTELDIASANLNPVLDIAAWAARATYQLPVELFTVNYDLLLETALEQRGVPYFDGFVGNIRARFRTDLVEALPGSDNSCLPALFIRLWKLHGSVNWTKSETNREIIRIGQSVSEDLPAAIYPSDAKYEESRRMPFIVLQDRFRRALNTAETLVMIAGYSFGDEHLNELIFTAAERKERSEFIVFCYSDLPTEMCDRSQRTPNVQLIGRTEAILGGVRAGWQEPPVPMPNVWEDGMLALPDFTHLARYLARSSTRGPESEADHLPRTEQAG